MDLQRAKIFLDKINREFAVMSKDPDNISTIDVDILRQYVRDFYDAILSEKSNVVSHAQPQKQTFVEAPAPKPTRPIGFNPERPATPVAPPKPEPKPAPQPVYQPAEPMQHVDNEPVTPVIEIFQPAPRPAPQPVYQEPEPVVARVAEPIKKLEPAPVYQQPTPAYQPTIEKIQEPKLAPKAAPQPVFSGADEATLALFEFKAAKELSEKLSEMPIADLRKALSLNDRLLMTREIFGGDAQELDKTLTTVNALGNFEEAKSYLLSFCADRFEWGSKARAEHARAFIKLVRRRFK